MNLRSSALDTPNIQRDPSVAPSPTPTRKVPHCRHCKRPRAGHPRSGCPYVNINNAGGGTEADDDPRNQIADALGSLHITPSIGGIIADDGKTKTHHTTNRTSEAATPRRSLSTTAGEVFERLRRQDETQEDRSIEPRRSNMTRITEWRSGVVAAASAADRVGLSDGNHSSQASQHPIAGGLGRYVEQGQHIEPPSPTSSISSAMMTQNITQAPTTKPLIRSMSMEERETFIQGLQQVSHATIYVLPKANVFQVQASAIKIGFCSRIVMNEEDEDLQALLILARDEDAVEHLSKRVEKEDREATDARKRHQSSGRSISLSVLAGGTVIGAVGAWAGLAFA